MPLMPNQTQSTSLPQPLGHYPRLLIPLQHGTDQQLRSWQPWGPLQSSHAVCSIIGAFVGVPVPCKRTSVLLTEAGLAGGEIQPCSFEAKSSIFKAACRPHLKVELEREGERQPCCLANPISRLCALRPAPSSFFLFSWPVREPRHLNRADLFDIQVLEIFQQNDLQPFPTHYHRWSRGREERRGCNMYARFAGSSVEGRQWISQ